MADTVILETERPDIPIQDLRDHLESALEVAENTEARYHLRSSIQLVAFVETTD